MAQRCPFEGIKARFCAVIIAAEDAEEQEDRPLQGGAAGGTPAATGDPGVRTPPSLAGPQGSREPGGPQNLAGRFGEAASTCRSSGGE
jgi:hypothetical protein